VCSVPIWAVVRRPRGAGDVIEVAREMKQAGALRDASDWAAGCLHRKNNNAP